MKDLFVSTIYLMTLLLVSTFTTTIHAQLIPAYASPCLEKNDYVEFGYSVKGVSNFTYRLNYTVNISGVKRNTKPYSTGGASNVRLKINNLQLQGTKEHKGFDLMPLLLENIPVKLVVAQKDQEGNIIQRKTYTEMLTPEGILVTHQLPIGVSKINCPISIDQLTFQFGERAKAFSDYVCLIDDYSKEVNKMKDDFTFLKNTNATSPNQINAQLNRLEKINTAFEKRSKLNFEALPIPNDSPDYFGNLYNNLQAAYQQTFDRLPNQYFEEGKRNMHREKDALAFFKAALRLRPDFGEPLYQITLISLRNGKLDQALADIHTLDKMGYDGVGDLVFRTYNLYLDQAEQALQVNNFDAAMSTYAKAKADLCGFGYIENCQQKFNQQIANVEGIIADQALQNYHLILVSAEEAVQRKRFTDAQQVVEDALAFQAANLRWIPTNIEAVQALDYVFCSMVADTRSQFNNTPPPTLKQQLFAAHEVANRLQQEFQFPYSDCYEDLNQSFEALYNLFIDRGTAAISTQRLDKAQTELKQAQNLVQKEVVRPTNRLQTAFVQLYKAQYAQKIEEGKQYLGQKYFNDAITAFKTAESICQNNANVTCDDVIPRGLFNAYFGSGNKQNQNQNYEGAISQFFKAKSVIERYPSLGGNDWKNQVRTAIQGSGKSLITQNLAKANQAVAANNLKRANELKGDIERMKRDYFLSEDYELSTQTRSLGSSIQNQDCINKQDTYATTLGSVQQNINQKQFVEASEQLETAILLAQNNEICGINYSDASQITTGIAKAVEYQKLMEVMHKAVRQNRYEAAIEHYLNAASFHQINRIGQTYDLPHSSLYDFIQSSNNYGLQVQGLVYFKQTGSTEKMQTLLTQLSRITQDKQKMFMERAGRLLAPQDMQTAMYGKWKEAIVQYALPKQSYKYFKKGYKKAW